TTTKTTDPAATAAAAATSADLAGLPKPVAKAIGKHQVLVVLCWNAKSGVDFAHSPPDVVADTELPADTLVGYVDTTTIDQSVVDALGTSTGLFTDAY